MILMNERYYQQIINLLKGACYRKRYMLSFSIELADEWIDYRIEIRKKHNMRAWGNP